MQDLTELPLELYTTMIAEELAEPEAAIGSSALLQDKTAFLAELCSLKVLPALQRRMNSAILIAPNLLLMQPKVGKRCRPPSRQTWPGIHRKLA